MFFQFLRDNDKLTILIKKLEIVKIIDAASNKLKSKN